MSDTMVVKEVKMGGTLNVKYRVLNDRIDEWEEIQKGFKEMPHPDLTGALNDLAQQIMQIFGFPNVHPVWGSYKVKKVKFGSNNKVSADIVFNHSQYEMIEVTLSDTADIPKHVVDVCLEEIKAFIIDKKKAQGEMFEFNVDDVEVVDEQGQLETASQEPLLTG